MCDEIVLGIVFWCVEISVSGDLFKSLKIECIGRCCKIGRDFILGYWYGRLVFCLVEVSVVYGMYVLILDILF